jgi:hypothetical protein
MAKSKRCAFDNGPKPGTRPVAGLTCVSGGAEAISTANCPCTSAPEASLAFALPASPAATV